MTPAGEPTHRSARSSGAPGAARPEFDRAGSAIAGVGLGPAFSGVMRSLAPLAPPEERGAFLASIYIATYLSFSLPTVIARIAVARYSLRETTYVYGVAVMVLAAITAVATSRRRTSRAAAADSPVHLVDGFYRSVFAVGPVALGRAGGRRRLQSPTLGHSLQSSVV